VSGRAGQFTPTGSLLTGAIAHAFAVDDVAGGLADVVLVRRQAHRLGEAQRLLGMLQLDTGHKLYLGTEPGKPQDRKGRDW